MKKQNAKKNASKKQNAEINSFKAFETWLDKESNAKKNSSKTQNVEIDSSKKQNAERKLSKKQKDEISSFKTFEDWEAWIDKFDSSKKINSFETFKAYLESEESMKDADLLHQAHAHKRGISLEHPFGPLKKVVEHGTLSQVKELINKIDHKILNETDQYGRTILIYALTNRMITKETEEISELLISLMNDKAINSISQLPQENAFTALYSAVLHGYKKICELLIPRMNDGAFNYIDDDGTTLLMLALLLSDDAIAQLLLPKMHYATIQSVDEEGCTALSQAEELGHSKIIKMIKLRQLEQEDINRQNHCQDVKEASQEIQNKNDFDKDDKHLPEKDWNEDVNIVNTTATPDTTITLGELPPIHESLG